MQDSPGLICGVDLIIKTWGWQNYTPAFYWGLLKDIFLLSRIHNEILRHEYMNSFILAEDYSRF